MSYFRRVWATVLSAFLVATEIGVGGPTTYAVDVGQELHKLVAADGRPRDFFGVSVAISGNLGAVGSPESDFPRSGGATDSTAGAAYLFDLSTGQQVRKLSAMDRAQGDRFGSSVAFHGSTVVVGTPFDDDGGAATGSAYVFDALTGAQIIKLTALDGAPFDQLGDSVAIYGGIALVGAPGDDDGAELAGSAYLFNATTGQQVRKLTASNPAGDGLFGQAVALNGSFAVVGAPVHDGAGLNSGAAYVFDIVTGQELFKLAPTDSTASDAFGNSVALSGNIAIIGANIKDGAGDQSGAAYLFDVTTGQQLHKLTPTDAAADDRFGSSVAIEGNLALVGARRDLGLDNGGASTAYVFDVNTGQQVVQLNGSGVIDGDAYGRSVAIGPTHAIVGSSSDTTAFGQTGSAFVFSVVPEPMAASLFGPGLMAMSVVSRRRPRLTQ
jgi:hypothetical protein